MTPAAVPWPPAVAGAPALAAIEGALGRGRLTHGLILAGDDADALGLAALVLAERILGGGAPPPMPAERHPDCLQVRPSGRSRQIPVAAIRELVSWVNFSPSLALAKVAIIREADRMNAESSNALLKVLEEPPAGTTLILVTARPYALLATIRSRALLFEVATEAAPMGAEGWEAWLADYASWLDRLTRGVASAREAAAEVITVYGLLARFSLILEKAADAENVRRRATLPEDLDEDEVKAIEAEAVVGLRLRIFTAIERATLRHARTAAGSDEVGSRRALASSVEALENAAGLLRLNMNGATALEDFLLASLRAWTKRK